MAHKICNLIKVFGKGAITFAESCKCFKHLLSFMTDLDSQWSHWLEMALLHTLIPFFIVKSIFWPVWIIWVRTKTQGQNPVNQPIQHYVYFDFFKKQNLDEDYGWSLILQYLHCSLFHFLKPPHHKSAFKIYLIASEILMVVAAVTSFSIQS